MTRMAAAVGAVGLALTLGGSIAPAVAQETRPAAAPKRMLYTLADITRAVRSCWRWPVSGTFHAGMELTVLLSFKRNGEIFGARITYQTRGISSNERANYHGALLQMIARCSPLPLARSLGESIAGHPFYFHFYDTRKKRKV
jgi:hypothetical protein